MIMTTNVLEYLEDAVKRLPQKTVFTDKKNNITYNTLLKYTRSIGTYIIDQTSGNRRQPIIVFVDRNVESLVACLGIAYSGNFYVPIEMQMPVSQIQMILETLHPLGALLLPSQMDFGKELNYDMQLWNYEEAIQSVINEAALCEVRRHTIDTDPLYSTFTSGSTGVPKGVITCHRNVIDKVEDLISTFHFSEEDVLGNQNPFYFDASIKDIFCTLRQGATMHIIPQTCFIALGDLAKFLNEHKVTVILWSAAAIGIVANSRAFDEETPKYLKKVLFSGEVMHNKVLNYWRRLMPDTMFVNLYGPTEITSVCSYYIVDRPYGDDEVLPIGIPFNNTDIVLLNSENKLVEGDEIGEICVRGTCLAMGYYNNAEKTRDAFCQNPLNTAFPEIIYRTGDLARYNEQGQIMFISRKDNQVKHMGHRVELGDIEIFINSLDAIEAAFCFYDHDKQKIVLVFSGKEADRKYIMNEMKDKFPKYMFPNIFIPMEVMPYNLNGKIDRTLLKNKYKSGELK